MVSDKKDNKGGTDFPSLFGKYLKISLQAISRTFSRFPITILLFLGLAAIIIYRIETPYERLKDISTILDRLCGVMALGIPFSLSTAVLRERLGQEKNVSLKIISYLAEPALLFIYYLFLFNETNMVSVTRLLMIALTMILSFLFIPYLPKRDHFEIYITNIITRMATTAFYTIVLALGLMATLFAIKSLLYSGMDPQVYLETWVLAWLVFAPLHFLYNLPYITDNFTIENFNKVIKIMLLYIVLPIITIFTIVLYLYFGKIIITQVWPKGIVSYLVVSYTAAGIAAIFLVSPFRAENKWVRVFSAAFTKLIFPLLGMMFISIGMRIGEFGFTENRYFILVIGLWATFIMIFLNFNKGKNTTVLPVSLAVVALLTVFGPWNAFEVSKLSQSTRFYQILSKYDLIQDGKVVKNNNPVGNQDKREISEILRYFDQSHKLKDLHYLPAGFTINQMKTVFGFSPVYASGERAQNYFSYNRNRDLPLTIKGYDMFFRLEAFKNQPGNTFYEKEISVKEGTVRLVLDSQNTLIVFKNSEKVYQYNLIKFIQPLYDHYGSNIDLKTKPENSHPAMEKMIFTDETSTIKIMIAFYGINGSVNSDNNGINIDNIDGDIFLTVK